MRFLLVVVGLSACGFDGSSGSGGSSKCDPGFVNLCGQAPLKEDLVVEFGVSKDIDTDNMEACTTIMQADGSSVCLLYYENVSIAGTLFGHGSRPLALAARDILEISGEIDVSSRRARSLQPGAGSGSSSCDAFARLPSDNTDGGGGAAGGTFLTRGGGGGTGDDGVSLAGLPAPALAQLPTVLRAGCPGGKGGAGTVANNGGAGGPGGGAVYLAGRTAAISGRILAGGAGGEGGRIKKGGGGGGGSGGSIVIQGDVVNLTGLLLASGGGGGEGGDNPDNGGDGKEPDSIMAAAGGTGRPAGGEGGTGSISANGGAGTDGKDGGGGGGGGGGLILVLSPDPMVKGMQAPMPEVRAK